MCECHCYYQECKRRIVDSPEALREEARQEKEKKERESHRRNHEIAHNLAIGRRSGPH